MPSYGEVLDARAAQPEVSTGPTPQQVAAFMRESARGAAILTELLDSPAWNTFRSVIAADLQRAEAERALLRDRIEAGETVGDERARADLRLQFLRGQIEAYQRALELPKTLIATHERLEKLSGGDANGRAGGVAPKGPDEPRDAGDPTAAPVVTSAAGAAPPKPRRKR